MKFPGLFAFFLVAGCAAGPTTQELETQAFVSGDWSKVEQRERMVSRRQFRNGIQCSSSHFGYCEVRFGKKVCTCLKRELLDSVFSSR